MTDASESIDLDEMRVLAEAATPGERTASGSLISVAGGSIGQVFGVNWRNDLEFAAATDPQTVLALIERVREAERLAAVRRDTIATYERENADWSIRVHAAERRIEKAEDFVTRHYLDTNMGRDVLVALAEGDKQ